MLPAVVSTVSRVIINGVQVVVVAECMIINGVLVVVLWLNLLSTFFSHIMGSWASSSVVNQYLMYICIYFL